MFFKKREKEIHYEILKHLYLEKESDRCYLFAEKPLTKYFNYYLYDFILRDLLLKFLQEKKACIKINRGDYLGLFYTSYLDICDYKKGKVMWLNNNKENDILLVFFDNINCAITSDLVNNYTGMWSYDGAIEIFAYNKESNSNEIHFDIAYNEFYRNKDFVLKLMPFNDGQGLGIYLNENTISLGDLREMISNILDDYFIELVVKS